MFEPRRFARFAIPTFALGLATLAACGDHPSNDAADAAIDAVAEVADVAIPDGSTDVAREASVDVIADAPIDTPVGTVDVSSDAPADVTTDTGCAGMICGSVCVDTATDVHHCGACGTDCTASLGPGVGDARCEAGSCVPLCMPGLADCNGNTSDGCETNVTDDALHCGSCGTACIAAANATARCTTGLCGFTCNAGYMLLGDSSCVSATPPRLIAPLSTATVTRRRPTLRWTTGAMDSHVQICADRACTTVLTEFETMFLNSGAPAIDLPAGTVFWRVQPAGSSGSWSATWQFVVPARDAGRDRSYGTDPDLDGDGFAELVVGAPRLNTDTGRVYVYNGHTGGIAATPSTWIDGPSTNTWFGMSVASAGDVNGDGFADLVVGAGVTNSYRGAAHVYYGSATGIHTTPDVTIPGPDLDGYFGYTVNAVGDLNGDGYGDLAVGAPQYASNSGRLYVFFGSATGVPTTPSLTIPSVDGSFSYFGRGFASAGDVNGDGFADLVVSGYGATVTRAGTSTAFSGRVHVYLGTTSGFPATPSTSLISPDSGAVSFGYAISAPGDFDGDGLCDLVVGAPSTSSNAGRVHVFAGHAGGILGTPTLSIDNPDGASAHFGWTLSMAGDVNGDGFSDLVAASDYASGHGHVYLGSSTGLATSASASQLQPSGASVATLGHLAAMAGDVDGDHLGDFVITGVDGSASTGFVALYPGNATTLPTTPVRVLSAPDPMAQFGQSAQ